MARLQRSSPASEFLALTLPLCRERIAPKTQANQLHTRGSRHPPGSSSPMFLQRLRPLRPLGQLSQATLSTDCWCYNHSLHLLSTVNHTSVSTHAGLQPLQSHLPTMLAVPTGVHSGVAAAGEERREPERTWTVGYPVLYLLWSRSHHHRKQKAEMEPDNSSAKPSRGLGTGVGYCAALLFYSYY